jgi:DNA-binding transcriptional ArsR family regulator
VALEHIALVRDVEAPPLQKLLLYALASRANHASRCWPSVRRVCQDTGLSRRAVQIHLSLLTASGALIREGRRGRSNVYRLTLSNIANAGKRSVDRDDVGNGGQQRLAVRMSCAPPAHDMRTPAHPLRAPCAQHAPEVKWEAVNKRQQKSGSATVTVDNRPLEANAPWWRSRDAVMQKGIELGLPPKAGEGYPVYKDRIYRASRVRKD